jgi:riboflavin synthase
MFTGIVEETGELQATDTDTEGRRLQITTTFEDLDVGQSISVNGACLTVEAHGEGSFEVFLASETVERTYLDDLEVGDPVNLERALPADGRLDGHMVQGHVDGTATITSIERLDEDWRFGFSLPESVAPYVVEKGSIAVDGISLTVAERSDEAFEVAIVPETYQVTNLAAKTVGDAVHLEVDIVAKYVESMLDGYQDG